MDLPYIDTFNLVLIGSSAVGKSSIFARVTGEAFSQNYVETAGVDFRVRCVEVGDRLVRLLIWDCSGSKGYITGTQEHCRSAHAAVIVYSSDDRASFEAVPSWIEQVEGRASVVVLAANKSDLPAREVTFEEGKRLADYNGFNYSELSALTTANIDFVLNYLATTLLRRKDLD
jgi:small GTP-binding protein